MLDIGPADFTQRANAIVEGEKAALAVMPQIRGRIAQLQAERAQALQLAQNKAVQDKQQACLENRSRLQKIGGMVGLSDPCAQP